MTTTTHTFTIDVDQAMAARMVASETRSALAVGDIVCVDLASAGRGVYFGQVAALDESRPDGNVTLVLPRSFLTPDMRPLTFHIDPAAIFSEALIDYWRAEQARIADAKALAAEQGCSLGKALCQIADKDGALS